MSLNNRIFLGALIGILLGYWFYVLGADSVVTQQGLYVCGLVSGVFVDLLKMLLIPLVFTSIAVGVARLREHHQIHQVWITTVVFSLLTTLCSIVLGLWAARMFHPGKGVQLDMFKDVMVNMPATKMAPAEFFAQFLHNLFMNPVTAMAQNNIMAVVVFALLLGIVLVTGGQRYKQILLLLEESFELLMLAVGWVMRIAPFGILALLAKLIATQDIHILTTLVRFMAVVIGTTLFHGVVVLPFILFVITRVSPLTFWRGARPALITAFATSSSSATLPITLNCLENELQVKPEIAGFVAPVGSHLNMDGTALYEAAAALFIANLVGVDLTLTQQLMVCIVAMIASIGAPGIPSAGMVTMVMVLQAVGLPAEAVAILLPIDRVLDTVRTMVNVEGDMVGSLVVQKLVNAN